MRILKKFLFLAATVGLISTIGLAKEAQAADGDINVYATVDGENELTWYWENGEDNEDYLYDNVTKAVFKVGSTTVYTSSEEVAESDEASFNVTDVVNSQSLSAKSISGSISLSLEAEYTDEDGNTKTKTVSATFPEGSVSINPLYRVCAKTNNSSYGSAEAEYDGVSYTSAFYVMDGESVTFTATPNSGYELSKWSTGETDDSFTKTISDTTYSNVTANFAAEAIMIQSYNIIASSDLTTTPSSSSVNVSQGATLAFQGTKSPSNAENYTSIEWYLGSSRLSVTSDRGTFNVNSKQTTGTFSLYAVVYLSDGSYVTSNSIAVTVVEATTEKITTSDFVEYVTTGYTMEFTATDKTNTDMTWYIVSGGDYAEIEQSWSSSKKTVKVKGKGDIDAGTYKEVVLGCKVNNQDAYIDSDSAKTIKLNVYSKPTLTYSSRVLTYKAPAKVNTGTTSGTDSSSSSSTETAVSDVKGVKIQVLLNGSSLGFTSTATSKGSGDSSYSIEASTVETLITNLKDKFSSTCDVTFRAYPCDSSGKYNKNIYADATAKVYKVVVKVTGKSSSGGTAKAYVLPVAMIGSVDVATSTTGTTTKEYVYYALEGQTIDVASLGDFSSLTNGIDDVANAKKIVVSSDESRNIYTGVLGTRTTTDAEGYDKVPKTGQSNVFVFVMIAVVSAMVCGGLYIYNKKSKENL